MPIPLQLTRGQVIDGKYEIIEPLGSGGLGTVFKGYHKLLDRPVALKLLSSPVFDHESRKRFEREALAISSLHHRNIVVFYGYGFSGKIPYIAMEYVPGISLYNRLLKGPLPAIEALRIIEQVCDALSCAHDNGIVHRDLKPSNIMLVDSTSGPLVKLIDFGLAKLLPGFNSPLQQLTGLGQALGTVVYMSPEQCSGQPVDCRSDLYAVGCILHECVDGSPPFGGEHSVLIMQKHVNMEPPRATFSDGLLTAQLQPVLQKCLTKSPDDRYQTAAELRADISAILADPQILKSTSRKKVSSQPVVERFTAFKDASKPMVAVKLLAATFMLGAMIVWKYSLPMNVFQSGQNATELYALAFAAVEAPSANQHSGSQNPEPDWARAAAMARSALALDSSEHLLSASETVSAYWWIARDCLNNNRQIQAEDAMESALHLLYRNHLPMAYRFKDISDLACGAHNLNQGRKRAVAILEKVMQEYPPDRCASDPYYLQVPRLLAALYVDVGRPLKALNLITVTREDTEKHHTYAQLDGVFVAACLATGKYPEALRRAARFQLDAKVKGNDELRQVLGQAAALDGNVKLAALYIAKNHVPGVNMIIHAVQNQWQEADRCEIALVKQARSDPGDFFRNLVDFDLRYYAQLLGKAGNQRRQQQVLQQLKELTAIARSDQIISSD